MKKIYLTALLIIGFIVSTNAQQFYWTTNWEISKGVGDTGDFIESVNFRGISFDGRYFINENVTVGGFVSWNALYDKLKNLPPIEFEDDGLVGHVSGTQVHYLNVFPILANMHYFFDADGKIKPYAGIGLGGVYVEQRNDIGFRSFNSDSFGFAAQPEIGVFIPFNSYSGTGINLAVRYLYGSSAGELKSLSMLNFAIGFGFMR